MKSMMRFALFSGLILLPAIAASWSGKLVNSECYSSHLNSNPTESHPGSYDMNLTIRLCRPETKTTTFGIVQPDGQVLALHASGNEKVIDLLRKAGKKRAFIVTVTGEMTQNAVKVETISLVP